jgi:Uma2 family endonuclease
MSAAPEEYLMSVKAYLALEAASPQNRYEYIDGHVLMMSGGSRKHALISANVIIALGQALRGSPCRVFTSDARVKLNDNRYVYPDMTVSCAAQSEQDEQNISEPALIAEVLSPSTEVYDRGQKLKRYRECPSLQTVLLIAQDEPFVEVYRRQSADIWTVQMYRAADEIDFDDIGVRLALSDIYARVTFIPQPEEPTE